MKLNPEQQKAVEMTDGPVLIVAGAGAGKTKTITERIVHIIKKGTSPHNILAITFTNKAAKEMRERVLTRLGEEGIVSSSFPNNFDTPIIKTFHSFGVYVLREQAQKIGLNRNFTIKDSSDSTSLIKEAMRLEGIDIKENEPAKFKHSISKWKSDFMSPDDVSRDAISHGTQVSVRVWRKYEELLKKENSLDFDDLLIKTVNLLKENESILSLYQNRFKYIHVDEYQDTNKVQYELCKLLAKEHKNICVVGDGDQNIYSWRGANIKNILQFEKDYENAFVVMLEENYRSTKTVLSAANSIISKNTVRVEKNLFTSKEEGEKISVIENYDEYTEALYVARKCSDLEKININLKNIAVLYRANFQSRVLEEAFLNIGVPYQMIGTKFFERKEIKDIVSYLRSSINRDSLLDIKRSLEFPKRGIGKVTMVKIFSGEFETLPSSMKQKISVFYRLLDDIKEKAYTLTLSETISFIISESGIEKTLAVGSDEDRERLENIRELVSLAKKYDNLEPVEALEKFFEETTLISDQDTEDEKKEGVKLMTVHASKGLEFDTVFIVGLEHDLFPHVKIGSSTQSKEESEEERRLFYVALTRAQSKLYLSYASIRTIYGNRQLQIPSEFIGDIDESLVEFEIGTSRNDKENNFIYI